VLWGCCPDNVHSRERLENTLHKTMVEQIGFTSLDPGSLIFCMKDAIGFPLR
jgi:hypothetical protein